MPALRAAGVSCFKIEGRKKSPLYVATTTDYYRKLLDGTLKPDDRPLVEADLQTVFSRPWTRLFVQSHKDKEVADRDTVGHRGTPIGRVEGRSPARSTAPRLAFSLHSRLAAPRRLADRSADPGQTVRLRGRSSLAWQRSAARGDRDAGRRDGRSRPACDHPEIPPAPRCIARRRRRSSRSIATSGRSRDCGTAGCHCTSMRF